MTLKCHKNYIIGGLKCQKMKKRLIPVYLGSCDAEECGHFRWSGDSYWDRNTECYCLLNGKSVYRSEASERRIACPMGRVMDAENAYDI